MQLEAIAREDAPKGMHVTTFPRHFFRIVSGLDDETPPVAHIGGMSGGPIFAVREMAGERRYWLVGVQSGWDRSARVVSVCPAGEPLLQALRAAVSVINEGGEPPSQEDEQNRVRG